MRIQTEYMSFKNRWTISSSYDSQVHLEHSQRRCHFFQTALQWFDVLPDVSLALPDAPRVVVGAPRLVVGAPRLVAPAPRCSQVHLQFSLALRGVLKLITNTPMVLLYRLSEIPVTLNACRNPLLGSDTLLKLTHLSLLFTSSQTLPDTSGD